MVRAIPVGSPLDLAQRGSSNTTTSAGTGSRDTSNRQSLSPARTITTKSRSLPTPASPRAYEPKHPIRATRASRERSACAHCRAAASTASRSGHLRTGECNDLTGIFDRLAALQRPVVLERCPFGLVPAFAARSARLIEVAVGLDEPIFRAIRHAGMLAEKGRAGGPAGREIEGRPRMRNFTLTPIQRPGRRAARGAAPRPRRPHSAR